MFTGSELKDIMTKIITTKNIPLLFDERLRLALILKSRREELGITQEELADKMGFTLKKIIAMEEARILISINKYFLWCQILNCELIIQKY